jgi:hypothetical protein
MRTENGIREWSSRPAGSGGTLTKIIYESVSVQIANQEAGYYATSQEIRSLQITK